MTKDEILDVLTKAKEMGIRSLDLEGLKVTFGEAIAAQEQRLSQTVPDVAPENLVKPLSILDEMTEEEVQYWATPRYDEIQAEKEAHQAAIKEEATKS